MAREAWRRSAPTRKRPLRRVALGVRQSSIFFEAGPLRG